MQKIRDILIKILNKEVRLWVVIILWVMTATYYSGKESAYIKALEKMGKITTRIEKQVENMERMLKRLD